MSAKAANAESKVEAPEKIFIQHYDDYSGIYHRGHGNYYIDGNDNFDAVEYLRSDVVRDRQVVLVKALQQCRALLSTLKHLDALDRMSLDAAVDLTAYKVDAALALVAEGYVNKDGEG